MRYREVALNRGYLKQRDRTARELAAFDATIRCMLKPILEQILEDQSDNGGQIMYWPSVLYRVASVRFPGVSEQDIRSALNEMIEEGWVEDLGRGRCRLLEVHRCNPEKHLELLYNAEGPHDRKVYQCRICGEGWTSIRKRGRSVRLQWERGANLAWLPRSIQAQRQQA